MVRTRMFFVISSVSIILNLQLGNFFKKKATTNAQKQQCNTTKGAQCPFGMNELYRVVTEEGITKRGCCSPKAGVKEELEMKAIAEGCSTTSCIPQCRKNPCATQLPNYVVNNTMLIWEQVYKENCVVYDKYEQPSEGHLAYCCHPDTLESALVSTSGAEVNEFPHQAAVSVDGGVCGGTIYNKRYIITAAHCVVDPETRKLIPFNQGKGYKITIGRNMWSNGEPKNVFGVEKVIVHEGYSKKLGSPELAMVGKEYNSTDLLRTYNDIALLRLDRDITFGTNVKAIRLADKGFNPQKFAKTAVVVGWGTSESGRVMGHLQKANFVIRPDKRCFNIEGYKRFGELRDKLVCLGGIVDGEWSAGTGSGDSGGPAICRGDKNGTPVLCGITSFSIGGINCVKKQNENSCYPSVFAEVGNYKSWVEKKTPEGQDERTLLNSPIYGTPTSALHQVQVTSSTGKSCGGTLIQSDIVVTAAHCVMYDAKKIHKGIKIKTSQGQILNLVGNPAPLHKYRRLPKPYIPAERERPRRIVMAENFHANDMAVLLLNKKVQGVRADQLPRLPEKGETPHGPVMEFARDSNTNELRKREFKILDKADCQERMSRLGIIKLVYKVSGNILCGVEKYSGGSQCDRELGGGLIYKGNDGKDVLGGVQTFRLCEWSIPNGFIDMRQQKQKKFVEDAILKFRSRAG